MQKTKSLSLTRREPEWLTRKAPGVSEQLDSNNGDGRWTGEGRRRPRGPGRYVEKGESGEEQSAVSVGVKCDATIDNKSLREVLGC